MAKLIDRLPFSTEPCATSVDPQAIASKAFASYDNAMQSQVGQIVSGQRVAADAMRLGFVKDWGSRATKQVHEDGNSFQVGRIHATSHKAKVVKHQELWDRANQQFIGIAMGENTMLPIPEISIPIFVKGCQPHPAGAEFGTMLSNRPILVDLSPETLCPCGANGLGFRRSIRLRLKACTGAATSFSQSIGFVDSSNVVTRKGMTSFAVGLNAMRTHREPPTIGLLQ